MMIPLRAPFRSDGIMTVLGDIDIIPDDYVDDLTDNYTRTIIKMRIFKLIKPALLLQTST